MQLKAATLGAIGSREKLPYQLFWSLFHSEIAQIRTRRQEDRDRKRELLYPFTVDGSDT
jgi:hypothetical protein